MPSWRPKPYSCSRAPMRPVSVVTRATSRAACASAKREASLAIVVVLPAPVGPTRAITPPASSGSTGAIGSFLESRPSIRPRPRWASVSSGICMATSRLMPASKPYSSIRSSAAARTGEPRRRSSVKRCISRSMTWRMPATSWRSWRSSSSSRGTTISSGTLATTGAASLAAVPTVAAIGSAGGRAAATTGTGASAAAAGTAVSSISSSGGSMMKRARLIGAGAATSCGTAGEAAAACSTLNGAKICSGSDGSLTAGLRLARARVAAKPSLPRCGTFSLAVSSVRPVAPTAARASAATAEVVAATGSGVATGALRRVTAAITASAALRGRGAGAGATSLRAASSARCTALSS